MAASTAAGKQRIPKVAKVGDREEPQHSICDVWAPESQGSDLCALVGEVARGLVIPSWSRVCPAFVPGLQIIGSVR